MDLPTIEIMERRIFELQMNGHPSGYEQIFHLLFHIGANYYDIGQFDRSIETYRRAVESYADRPDAHYNLGEILFRTGDVPKAIDAYLAALQLCPDHTGSLQNLAAIRFDEGKFDEAESLCLKAIQISSKDVPQAHAVLASILSFKGDLSGSSQHFTEAKKLTGESHCPTEILLERLKIQQGQKRKNCQLASINQRSLDNGNISDSIRFFRDILKKNPNSPDTIGQLNICLQVSCDWKSYADRMENLSDLINKHLQENLYPPVDLHAATNVFPLSLAQQLGVAKYFSQIGVMKSGMQSNRYRLSGKQLRVGYIFTGALTFPLVGADCQHNLERIEVFCYCLGDDTTLLKAIGQTAFNRHVVNLSIFKDNRTAANRIIADGIRILVNLDDFQEESADLNGILAYRPAPIQVVYRSVLGSTGATYMDYFITDKVASPLRFSSGYSEKLAYMPNGMFVCANRTVLTPPQGSLKEKCKLRRRFGLPESAVVFGVKSRSFQIDPDTFQCWCEILRKVPSSVIWFCLPYMGETQSNLKKAAKRHKINPHRLIFPDDQLMSTLKDPIRMEDLIDVVLDIPLSNGFELIDLITSGIPIVTLPMESFRSRLTASILTSISCVELIAKSKFEYVRMAVNLGNKAELLSEMKAKMREILPHSHLYRIDRYFDDLETLYEKIWCQRQMGEKPEHIV